MSTSQSSRSSDTSSGAATKSKVGATDSQSVISRTSVCNSCKSVLITRGLTSGQQIRCGRCGQISQFGKNETVPTHRLAWTSFWLGLSSLVLLFITGIPAVYYGVKSLLRMRYVRPKTSDRVAAIAGTTLGGCFGVAFGSLVAFIGIFIALIIMTASRSNDPIEVQQAFSKVGKLDLPADVKGLNYLSLIFDSQCNYEFSDSKNSSDRTFFVSIARHSIQINRATMIQQLRREGKPRTGKLDKAASKMLKWKFGDTPFDVYKRVYDVPQESTNKTPGNSKTNAGATAKTDRVQHYYGVVSRHGGLYGIAVSVNVTKRPMTDEELQAIFESFEMPEESSPSRSTPDSSSPQD